MNIFIVEDQNILLESLKDSLSDNNINVIATANKASEILSILRNKRNIDLVLSDIVTADNENVLDYITEIKSEFPKIKIVLITSFPEITFLERAKRLGIDSFVYKYITTKQLLVVINNTMEGYSVFPSKPVVDGELFSSLTPSEMKVLRLYCAGLERKEIMEKLYITESGLKVHISSILRKTGFPSIARAAIYAVKNGLIISDVNEID